MSSRRGFGIVKGMQEIGRSLQLPLAALPAAGIMVRLGQPDVFGSDGLGWTKAAEVFGLAGNALLGALPLLFCVGVAIGYAKEADGSTAFAALAGHLVFGKVLEAFPDQVTDKPTDPGVLGGIVIGLITAVLWQRYHRTRLPDWLGFFSGRRLVPVLMAFAGLAMAVAFGLLWAPVGNGLNAFAAWLSSHGAVGSGIFGFINRMLVPIGMHMLLNTYGWFQFGSFTGPQGQEVHGDIARFLAGDPSAGMWMTGFFPIMMFALPAAGLAIAHCARPERRKAVTGMMVSIGLTAMITGVSEPLEFSFMFIAPVLYGIHALLTGLSMFVTMALGVKAGFTFSAGLFDYTLNWSHATRPWLIIPIGLCFAAVYYVVFRFVITKFDLPTPGREPEEEITEEAETEAATGDGAAAERADASGRRP
ncbi:PTS transporter subunit EIIC [Streptomyces sp. NPDC051563]|uniref:PTS transporter subunit EIIC n=1 Tax=Streptomyces sp. NPDC051563 TaxID=3365659 RepID=UPI0037B1439D